MSTASETDNETANGLRVLYQESQYLGGAEVHTELDHNYKGASAVKDLEGKVLGVLPTYQLAECVAIYAATREGGFGSTSIHEAQPDEVTHESFWSWLDT